MQASRERPMHPTRSTCAVLACIMALTFGGAAYAEPEPEDVEHLVMPPACQRFVAVAEDTSDEGVVWSQGLSLAACVQDTSIIRVDSPDELAPMVAALAAEMAPSMLIYLAAIERGSGRIQLRAAYHLGLSYVGLVTRARSGIVAPPDLATNREAARRYAELRAELEPLLIGPRRAAFIAFTAIDRAVEDDPSLVTDEIERQMVRHARALLPLLREPADSASDEIQVAKVR
jgi:hypothetical protein